MTAGSISISVGSPGDAFVNGLWVQTAVAQGIMHRTPTRRYADATAGIFNMLSSFVRAARFVLVPDTLLSCVVAAGSTLLMWFFAPQLAVPMSWSVVSLAVIFPISGGINSGFKRREVALSEFGMLLGNVLAVWGAVHTWRIKDGGTPAYIRLVDKLKANPPLPRESSYSDTPADAPTALHRTFDGLLLALIVFFDTTRWGRARQTLDETCAFHPCANCCGTPEAQELRAISAEQRLVVHSSIARLQRLVQHLKVLGLPGGEAHRLDQYVSKVSIAFEKLSALKEYRSPQAFRAFARVYILVIGALYGPSYLALAHGTTDPPQANLGLALVFACTVQIIMSGLFHVMLGLEDPFARRNGRGQVDSIHVPSLCEVARRQMRRTEHEAAAPWDAAVAKETW